MNADAVKNSNIARRQEKEREALFAILRETPIITFACKKVGINRSTYYRWLSEDAEFAKRNDAAMDEGIERINDMSESQLIKLIQDERLPAIGLWLKAHHRRYSAESRRERTKEVSKPPVEKMPVPEYGEDPEWDNAMRGLANQYDEGLRAAIVAQIRRKAEREKRLQELEAAEIEQRSKII